MGGDGRGGEKRGGDRLGEPGYPGGEVKPELGARGLEV